MKKTLIALMALAGIATANEYSGTFSWAANTNPVFTLSDEVVEEALTLTNITCNKTYKATGVAPGALTPDQNIGSAAGNSWTLTFNVNNTTSQDIVLTGITLDAFLFNGGGNAQNADEYARPVAFTLANGTDTVASTTVAYANSKNDWENDAVFSFGEGVTLAANSTATYTLTVSNAQTANNYGTFVGLKGATFTTAAIPEPTTATLSLLALAGLAARRRRK